jgi:hypothetical protein
VAPKNTRRGRGVGGEGKAKERDKTPRKKKQVRGFWANSDEGFSLKLRMLHWCLRISVTDAWVHALTRPSCSAPCRWRWRAASGTLYRADVSGSHVGPQRRVDGGRLGGGDSC